MVSKIKFRDRKALSSFQNELDNKVSDTISDKTHKIIKSDKNSNLYKISIKDYDTLMSRAVEKSYKLANSSWIDIINLKIEDFAEKLGIEDRVMKIRPQEAFISLKDHKPSWERTMPTRLINPANSDLCKISKKILDKALAKLRMMNPHLNQFRSSDAVLEWFEKKTDKNHFLLTFDIESFYPSISKEVLTKCLDWAEENMMFDDHDREVIMAARRSVLFFRNQVWTKKGDSFDVTMGSSDGAEISELVGLFLLDRLNKEEVLEAEYTGLYRDDGLAMVPAGNRDGQKLRERIIKFFKKYGFGIEVSPVSTSVDYLDIRLHANKSHEVYHKPNSNTNYVHSQSNHPKNILKNMSANTEQRISKLCSSEVLFNKHVDYYSSILKNSGHRSDLKYEKKPRKLQPGRTRTRKMVWYNPPFCLSVKTKIGKRFFEILNDHWPEPVPHPNTGVKPERTGLNLILNKNTVKLSFSTMNNIAAVYNLHNKTAQKMSENPPTTSEKMCSCPRTKTCPVGGKCLTKNVIYEAKVTEKSGFYKNQTSSYTGLASTTFKSRYYGHTSAIKNRKNNQTGLTAFIHELKDAEIDYELTWKILEIAPSFDGRHCRLCLSEKTTILFSDDPNQLNKRTELSGKCRHTDNWTFRSRPSTETQPVDAQLL